MQKPWSSPVSGSILRDVCTERVGDRIDKAQCLWGAGFATLEHYSLGETFNPRARHGDSGSYSLCSMWWLHWGRMAAQLAWLHLWHGLLVVVQGLQAFSLRAQCGCCCVEGAPGPWYGACVQYQAGVRAAP